MVGITSFGGFVPRLRLNRQTIFQAMGWYNPATFGIAQGTKAVANYDEDSVTMAVAAAIDCLQGRSRDGVAALYLASTTMPYELRDAASLVAAALDLPSATRTMDVADTLRAGTGAVLAAVDAVSAGLAGEALVTSSDCRVARMGSLQEHVYGDGAAALLVGKDHVVAEFKGSHSITADLGDTVRETGQRFDRTWEERWVRDEGYSKLVPEAAGGLLEKLDVKPDEIAKVILPGDPRTQMTLGKRLGLSPEQGVDPMIGTMGDLGAAQPIAVLTAALQTAKPGDRILVVSYGQGCDALLFEVTDAIKDVVGDDTSPKGVAGCLDDGEDIQSYQRYAMFRELIPAEKGIRGEFQAPTAFSTLARDRRAVMGLVGSRCGSCGTPQYPPQRICVKCGATDQMSDYRFSDRAGEVFTYTGDMLAFSVDPPAIYGIVDMEGGGRLYLDFTDCKIEDLQVGMPVGLSFRRKYHDEHRGISGYFWKAVPVRA